MAAGFLRRVFGELIGLKPQHLLAMTDCLHIGFTVLP